MRIPRTVACSSTSGVNICCLTLELTTLINRCACPFTFSQSVVFASIGVLIDESVQQLMLFGGQLFVTCILLARFKPFANR